MMSHTSFLARSPARQTFRLFPFRALLSPSCVAVSCWSVFFDAALVQERWWMSGWRGGGRCVWRCGRCGSLMF